MLRSCLTGTIDEMVAVKASQLVDTSAFATTALS